MGYPTLTYECAFATDPLAVPTWVDITAYVLSCDIRYGRSYELDRFEAGTATLVLDNMDRRFDPTNASSPYYPNVVPTRRIRVSATWSAVTYRLFTGFVQAWPPNFQNPHNDEMTVPCADGFLFLNGLTYDGAEPSEYSNQAVIRLLNDVGWPAGDRLISNGNNVVLATTDVGNVLSRLQAISAAEGGGGLFIDGAGRVVFQDRHYRFTNGNSVTSTGIFGYAGGQIPYRSLQPVYDDTSIKNDIHVSAVGGTEYVASDTDSQDAYFTRSLNRTGLIIGDASPFGGATANVEAEGLSNWILFNSKDPQLRFARMTLSGFDDDTVWPHALGRQISDRITAVYVPPAGATITRDCYVESIAHHIAQDSFVTTWQLSPADLAGGAPGWWILNVGLLGTTTRLAH